MRHTVITGIGVVAPGGPDRESFWQQIVEGRTATGPITLFDASGLRSRIAAECAFDPRAAGVSDHEIRRTDRYVQLGLVAAAEAVAESGLDLTDDELADRVAVSQGTAVGGNTRLGEDYVATSNGGRERLVDPDYASPFLYEALVPSTLAAEVAARFGARGPATVISTGCTAGIDAVGHGHQLIQDGEADVVIAGAAESGISPLNMASFDPIGATSTRNDDPATASRPFDGERDGFVMGEGAAVLVLEEREHARARGVGGYCEITGYASRCNAFHMTGLRPDGVEMAEAIGDALRQGRHAPADIDYVNAHGSGTRQNDIHETAAIKRALGEHAYRVPISSIKSMVGHSLGAIGAIEVAACALAIARGAIPPTANLRVADAECDLDYTPRVARRAPVTAALCTGSGFGGFQSAIVLAEPIAKREREAA
jgi:minimal PKS ketosynthase (KS/KS alpha)